MAERNNDDVARALEHLSGGRAPDAGERASPGVPPPARPTAIPRPAAPSAPRTPAAAPEPQPIVYDDDAVIVPAPDASVFLHARKNPTQPRAKASFGQSLSFRRTVIPMLLTGGVILIGLGVLRFIWGGPLAGLPPWVVGLLFFIGLLLWGLAGANMVVVRHMLESSGRSVNPPQQPRETR